MTPLLEVSELSKTYAGRGGAEVRALDAVSFTLGQGEVLGIVGESGCGKSTLGHAVVRLIDPTSGRIRFDGVDITTLDRRSLKRRRRDFQIVFQDPFGSLNPRHKVGEIIREPLDIHGVGTNQERARRVTELVATVGLPAGAINRYPHDFSGGQRQRIAIARALALSPKLIVADEPVSSLDVSVQSQIINLVAELRREFGLSILFISHDLSVVRHVSDRMAVMYLGRIVEIGPAGEIMDMPMHPYTVALLSAIPKVRSRGERRRVVLAGEPADPAHPPSGCAFRTRCPSAMPVCAEIRPALAGRVMNGTVRTAACHLFPEV
ncbi:dipeptide ABC transporter ATP-binding protein [soil metagenome]